MVRRLLDDFREFPAMMTLCSLWVIVFALMLSQQMMSGHVQTFHQLMLGVRGGHAFGELTIRDLFQGEIWRPLTATFVHYGLLHIGMNLYIMYHLGAAVESWYGPWQFLAVYVVIGFGGNLLSALARHALGSDPMAASGGGSTVVLGLVALCAVVGARSHTRTGSFLKSQMLGLLIATALLGQMVPIIDNWGHAGGALTGALIGFAHRTLIRTARQPVAWGSGGLALLLLVASAVAQVRDDRAEAAPVPARDRERASAQAIEVLQELNGFFPLAVKRSLFEHSILSHESERRANSEFFHGTSRHPWPSFVKPLWLLDSTDEEFRAGLKWQLDRLDALGSELGTGPTQVEFRRLRALLAGVLDRPPPIPPDALIREFNDLLEVLVSRARRDEASAVAEVEASGRRPSLPWDLNRRARSPAGRPAGAGDGPSAAARPR